MSLLYVIQGRNRGTRYDLTAHSGAVSIGREAGNTVQLGIEALVEFRIRHLDQAKVLVGQCRRDHHFRLLGRSDVVAFHFAHDGN